MISFFYSSSKKSGLPEKTGYLYVIGYDQPFSSMKVNKQIRDLNGKIIECRWGETNQWEFMRERVDKSYPNHYNTAMGKKFFF
jgi:mRNA-capping enzyme